MHPESKVIIISVLLTIVAAWIGITLGMWLFMENDNACWHVCSDGGVANLTTGDICLGCWYNNEPIRFTLPEILGIQWKWISAHKVV